MACRLKVEVCKRTDEVVPRGFDLTDFCARFYEPETIYAVGDVVRLKPKRLDPQSVLTGYEYRAETGGQGLLKRPKFPGIGAIDSVQDGPILWRRQPISAASLYRTILGVGNVTWTPTAPMTVSGEVLVNTGGEVQIAALHGGGLAMATYDTVAHVQFTDGSHEDFVLHWTITD